MIKVADTNYLQSEELDEYLGNSPQNFVALTDYSAMEAYKSESMIPILKSTETLSKYPAQVLILHATRALCTSGPIGPAQMIEPGQTRNFAFFCEHLVKGANGNPLVQKEIAQHRAAAQIQMDKIKENAAHVLKGFEGLVKTFTEEEIRAIRTKANYTSDITSKIVKNVMTLTALFIEGFPDPIEVPSFEDLPYTFLFRNTLCTQMLFLNWVSQGRQTQVKSEKILNDIIDVNFAAHALYFDGLLSNDRKLIEIYEEARAFLNFFCGRSDSL